MSLSQKVFEGTVWSIGVKWINRALGLVSAVILTRLLSPEDFGVAALATLVMFFFLSMSELGIRQYIIKTPDIEEKTINSAWSLQLLINGAISIAIILSSPLVSRFLGNESLENVLKIIALIPVFAGLTNPGAILAAKRMQFSKVAKLDITAKLISAPVAVYIAVIYRSYWALVLGQVLHNLLVCVFSFLYFKYRPKFTLGGYAKICSATKWLLVSTITGFTRSKIEGLIVNSKFGAEGVGLYDTSREFSHLPLSDIIGPASEPLLAGVSAIQSGVQDVFSALLKHLYVAFFFILPSIVGIFLTGDLFVRVVMGEQWVPGIPVFITISLLMPVFMIYSSCRTLMLLNDDLFILAVADFSSIVLMLGLLTPKFVDSLEVLTSIRVGIGVFFAFSLMGIMAHRYKLNVWPIFQLFSVVLVLCCPLAGFVAACRMILIDLPEWQIFTICIFAGVTVYLITILSAKKLVSGVNEYFLFVYEFLFRVIGDAKAKLRSASGR